MSQNSRPQVGAMTRAMSAQRTRDEAPRVLRIGILQGESSLEERIIRERATVTAGTTERATLPVSTPGFPAHLEVFVLRDDRWHLRVGPGFEGRVAIGSGVHSLEACVSGGLALPDGDAWLLALDDHSRGKVIVSGVTFLFQFAHAAPVAPRPQVPTSLRARFTRDMDWRYNASLASFLSIALAALTWVEYGYDPVIDDNNDLIEFVARRVHLSPSEDQTPPEPPPTDEAAADAPTNTPINATPRPSHHASTDRARPSQPNANDVQRAIDRANEAAARAQREFAASFAAITNPFAGPGNAVEQLQSQVLMAGNAEDLRNTTGITSAAPGVARNTTATSNTVNSQTLGRNHAVSAPDAPTTGTLTGPVGPRRPLTVTPDDPITDTCDGDAAAVARVIRNNLGGIRTCYERSTRNHPNLHGRLSLRFTVSESGRASTVNVQGVDPDLDTCVENAVRRMVFPVPACGVADYEYPINVDPAE